MSSDKSHNDIGASYVCAYCGEPMIDPWESCCGEVHWVETDKEDETEQHRSTGGDTEGSEMNINGNELSLGRNWFTADQGELTTFGDCARWTLKWNDGAEIYCVEDTEQEAREALRRYGFSA